jgi:hypothetical protein
MNLSSKTNLELIHMAMHDGVDLSLRYAAARELQERRSKPDSTLYELWKGRVKYELRETV